MQLIVIQLVAFLILGIDTAFDTVNAVSIDLLSIPLLFNIELKELGDNENMHPFRAARLSDRNGDLKKRWYINYYVWDVQKNALVRKQYYEINNYKTVPERYAAAKIAVRKINELLQKGFHIDKTKLTEQKELKTLSISKAVNLGLELKKSKVAHSSYLSISSPVNKFIEYLEDTGYDLMLATNWKRINSIKYLDYLLTVQKISPTTVNKYRDYLKSIFTLLEEREIVDSNPWKGIKKEKVVKTKANMAFTSEQIKLIIQTLKKTDTELLAFIQIMFYTFMRPNEIRQTKVKNVLIEERKIIVSADISKNRIRSFIDIPEQLIRTLIPLLKNKSPNDFIFQSFEGRAYGKNTMSMRHREILKNLSLDNDHTLYSWKHTGVVQAYKNGVNIKSIQLQCRHYSIAQTDEYLKSLGIFENKEIKFGMPNLPQ